MFYHTTHIIRRVDAPVNTRKKNIPSDAMAMKFKDFVENEWDDDYMYTPSDFIVKFGITRHLSRYYLMDLVYQHVLFRVKYANKTFYGKHDDVWISKFREFTWMGVEVTS